MAREENKENEMPETALPGEMRIDEEETGEDLASYLEKLEQQEAKGADKPPPTPVGKPATKQPTKPISPDVAELQSIPTPAPTPKEGVKISEVPVEAFEDVLMEINTAANLLKKFSRAHPYLIAPNIMKMLEEELTETSGLAAGEYHRLRESE